MVSGKESQFHRRDRYEELTMGLKQSFHGYQVPQLDDSAHVTM